MAQIRIDLAETLVDGMDIKFKAPCACNEITGLIVYYPVEGDVIQTKEFVFRDSHGNDLTGIGNLFSKDAYVKVIADVENGFAYIQNADNNGFLNSAIFGTYTHDAENLIGSGENGKFKASVSGTISSINVNGVSCSVKCGEDTSMDLIAGCWYTFILDGTTVNFSSGGAGAGLNFKVVGGTTEPVSPRENMIWVNTNMAIVSYVFAAVEPPNLVDGLVWIIVGASSPVAFSATKKNPVMVYPISAKQYVNGAWVDVTAKTYQNGKWSEWTKYLYNKGDECTGITGGWETINGRTDGYTVTGKYTNNGDSYTLTANTAKTCVTRITKNKIDLTEVKTIFIVITEAIGQFFDLLVASSTDTTSDRVAYTRCEEESGIVQIDVSDLTGMYYIAVQRLNGDSGSNAGSVTVSQIYMK